MQKGDVILVDYTGKDLISNRVFDTTVEAKAKESNLFDARIIYKPVPIILGRHEMLNSLEDELEKMNVGETKKIVLPPKKGFGDRDARNIRLASLKDFREHQLAPYPGMIVEVNGAQGKVQSVSGGRVRIDFNHPLAGKELENEVSIRKKFDSLQEQANALFDKFFPFVAEKDKKVSEKNGEIEITLPESAAQVRELDILKQVYTKVLKEHLTGVKEVKFTKPQEKETAAKTEKVAAVETKNDAVTEEKAPAKPRVYGRKKPA